MDEACTDFCQGALECANGRCARHLSPGAPCGGSIPGHCVQEHQCLDGSCQRLPQVEAGAHCPSDLSCPRELICAHSAQDVCQPGPGVGEACDVGACALGLYCEPGRELCRAYAALGDSCIDETCGPGLYCDQRPGGWTCAERALRWHYCP